MIYLNKADKTLTERKDFLWGVNIHSSYYSAAYKFSNLEELLYRAKDMGSGLIRLNGNSPIDELDASVKLCNAYGMKVMVVQYIRGFTVIDKNTDLQSVEDDFYNVAMRYNGKNGNGKIDFIQIHNEMDLALMNVNPKGGSDGDKIENWDEQQLNNVVEQVKSAIKGVKKSDTDAKTVINFCWLHYGMLDYFYNNGVDWDITGHDWYGDQMNAYETHFNSTAYGIGELLYKKFRKKIIVCESNYFNFDISSRDAWDDTKEETFDILIRGMEDAYSQEYVIGFTFYELVDELQFESSEWQQGDKTWNREAHFGLLFADRDGNLGEPKPIYNHIKKVIGGNHVKKYLCNTNIL